MFFLFFSFFSLWHHLFQLEVREGGSNPAVTMERTGAPGLTFFISPVCQCPHKSSRASVFLFFFWEYWKYIRYCKRRGTKEHPLHGHATSGGQQTNRRAQAHRPAEPRADGQTMMTKRWRDVPPSSCPREREREMALILAWWHTTGQPLGCECFPLRWGKRKGGRAGGKENEVIK